MISQWGRPSDPSSGMLLMTLNRAYWDSGFFIL